MYMYKKYFKSGGLEYHGGQNTAASKKYLLWVNKGNVEFAIWIGEVDNQTHKVKLYPESAQLPKKDIDRLIELVT